MSSKSEAAKTLADLPMPAVVIRDSALRHNIRAMTEWTRRLGFDLSPHGKTTMCPQIFRRQLEAGAWGITAATSAQAVICLNAGATRVLIANQLAAAGNIRQLRETLETFPGAELYCLADSLDALDLLHRHWRGAQRPMQVLIEMGRDGWRTGARSMDAALQIYECLRGLSPDLEFAGLEGFEGSAASASDAEQFVNAMINVARQFPQNETELIFSVGGSAYLGVLAKTLKLLPPGWRPVIRSGCYVTHDHGFYEQRRQEAEGQDVPQFHAALELWAAVQSIPEAGLAILTFGKRNASFDLGLPIPLDLPDATVTALNDQHAYLRYHPDRMLKVGDLVRMGISHPCTTFDKWKSIPLVDDEYNVLEIMETCF